MGFWVTWTEKGYVYKLVRCHPHDLCLLFVIVHRDTSMIPKTTFTSSWKKLRILNLKKKLTWAKMTRLLGGCVTIPINVGHRSHASSTWRKVTGVTAKKSQKTSKNSSKTSSFSYKSPSKYSNIVICRNQNFIRSQVRIDPSLIARRR